MRARPGADHSGPRLAAVEQDRRGDREDVVPRGRQRVLVDVQLRDLDLAVCLRLQLLQDRLDRATRPAPRRPEVEDDRHVALEHVALERLVGYLEHGARVARYRRPAIAASRSAGTLQIASATIARDIFEPPASRSANVIGPSTTRKPARRAR